jgi:hypothetical protein
MRILLCLALAAAPAAAIPPLPPPEVVVGDIAMQASESRLRADIGTLVGFGTRHTLSSQTDPKRGIGAAVNWAEATLKGLGLKTLQTCEVVTKPPRVPAPTRVCNAVGIQVGTERPNDVVIITGHIDSRVSDVMNATADAPGANDDGSGTAAVIEAARLLSKRQFPGTIVYAALSGEEQGLIGGRILADYAKAQGWNVIANLNNDIIGNSCGSDGTCDAKTVRVFSEGPRWQGREALAAEQRSKGGENDSPSRNLSRFLDDLAGRLQLDLDVRQIWRNDRFGRGGDHTEFLNAGFPAVRLTVAVEDYDHQHQDLRVEKGTKFGDTADEMDFAYLAKVTKLNTAALAWLASAPPPPEPVVEGAVSTDTVVAWDPIPGAVGYMIHRRATDSTRWEPLQGVGNDLADAGAACPRTERAAKLGKRCSVVLKGVRVDDWIFGVSATERRGFASPIAAAVPGGAFKPYVKASEEKK